MTDFDKRIGSNTKEKLSVIIRNLEATLVSNTVKVLKETTRIYYKSKKKDEQLTEQEAAYFENCEALFARSLSDDNLWGKLDEYILRNKQSFVRELNTCK